jgi:hypothetical protein
MFSNSPIGPLLAALNCARLYALMHSRSAPGKDTLNLKQPVDKLTQWAFFAQFLAPSAGERGRSPGTLRAPALQPARPLQDNLEGLISRRAAGARSMMQRS